MSPMDEKYTRISNDILEALARTNLSAYEWRVVMVVFRKTYGFQKKSDWLAPATLAKLTGLSRQNICKARRMLIARNIVVYKNNEISFNKYHTQWRLLSLKTTRSLHGHPKDALSIETTPIVSRDYERSPERLQNVVSIDAHKRKEKKKDILTKEMPFEKTKKTTTNDNSKVANKWSDEEILKMEKQFKKVVVENQYCDIHYADKTWNQSKDLRTDNRNNFYRKVDLMLKWNKSEANHSRAGTLFHEIAGFVNDKGAMERVLDSKTIQKRSRFTEDNKNESEDGEDSLPENDNNESFL